MINELEGRRDDYTAVNFGLNESIPVVDKEFKHLIKAQNFRVSKDGSRLQKRDGLTLLATITGGAAVYGYQTYYNAAADFSQVAVTATAIWRKTGSAAWVSIHTWSTPIAHPVKIFEVQDKVYVFTEYENKVILPAGGIAQVGITAPVSTNMTVTASYDATLLLEDCADISDWDDDDVGTAASSQVAFGGKSCMRLLCAAAVGDIAKRSRTVTGIGDIFVLELDAYFNTLGTFSTLNHFQVNINTGIVAFQVRIDKNDIFINSGGFWSGIEATVYQDAWMNLKFLVKTATPGEEYVEIFQDGVSLGEFLCGNRSDLNPGLVEVMTYGNTVATDVYLDNITISGVDGGKVRGLRRFAVTYIRDGNYPCESNPLKSMIGADAFTGAGLDDLTVAGEYTGGIPMNIRVEIDANGTPDAFKWSEDGGKTWVQTGVQVANSALVSYGIELQWAATTGHTVGNYWDFTCSAFSVDACMQRVTLANIPVSTDPQVTKKGIYMTTAWGADFYLVGVINNAQAGFTLSQGDEALGRSLEEDRDVAPTGRMACWWDDRMWVLSDGILYYSDSARPEEFYLAGRFINVRMADSHDKPTCVIPYQGNLYVFKQNSIIRIVKRTGGAYGRYELPLGGVGAPAGWSVAEVGGLLVFQSDRGVEVFNGETLYDQNFFTPVARTLEDYDDTEPDKVCAIHHPLHNELLMSYPDMGAATPTTIAVNYITGRFFPFRWAYVPTCFSRVKDSTGKMKTYMGTSGGLILEVDDPTALSDNGTAITAYARFNWLRNEVYRNWRHMEVEFECPTGFNLTANVYMNFDKDVFRTKALAGSTPSATDIDLREPLLRKIELGLRGQYMTVEFSNAEAVGGDLKITYFMVISSETGRKRDIVGD